MQAMEPSLEGHWIAIPSLPYSFAADHDSWIELIRHLQMS